MLRKYKGQIHIKFTSNIARFEQIHTKFVRFTTSKWASSQIKLHSNRSNDFMSHSSPTLADDMVIHNMRSSKWFYHYDHDNMNMDNLPKFLKSRLIKSWIHHLIDEKDIGMVRVDQVINEYI